MEVEVQKGINHVVVIPRRKSVDASVAAEFKKKMQEIINSGISLIVLDMRDVSFIDSTGLGSIISAYKTKDKEQTLVLCNIAEGVQDIFKITKLDKFFTIFSSKESAFKALKIDDQ